MKEEDTQEQSETTEVQEETQTEEVEELSEEQVADQISHLTSSEEVVEEEVQAEEQTETETEQTEEVQAEIPIIDDEMIKKYPVLRSYYGKPVTQLADSYQRIVSQFTTNSQKLKELENKLAESSLQDTGDYPDPVEKPEEFKKWLADREEKIKSLAQKPEPQVDLMVELATRLPQGTDVNAVVDGWSKQNAVRLFDAMGNLRPEMQSLYTKNPEILYQEVSDFQKLQEKENQTEEVVRKAGHKELRKNFKKARDSKKDMPNANVQTLPRDVQATEEEEMLIRLHEIVQEE